MRRAVLAVASLLCALGMAGLLAWETGGLRVVCPSSSSLSLSSSSSSPATCPSRPSALPFWAFVGVTSQAAPGKAAAVMATWGSRLERIHWYGEGNFEASLGAVTQVEEPVYLKAVKKGKGYDFMGFKLQWIWRHVLQHVPPTKWVIRHFDDSYIFLNAMKNELELYDSTLPLLVGHRHFTQKGKFAFPDGGNPWALSFGAIELLREKNTFSTCINGTVSEKLARKLLGGDKLPCVWCAEDIHLWYCIQKAGVKFVHYRGESWFPGQIIGTPQFDPFLWRSAVGMTSQHDPLMLPSSVSRPYYCALHPVPISLMKDLWKKEKKVLQDSKLPLKINSS